MCSQRLDFCPRGSPVVSVTCGEGRPLQWSWVCLQCLKPLLVRQWRRGRGVGEVGQHLLVTPGTPGQMHKF